MVPGVDDEAGDFTGLAMNAYWTQNEILRADFRELATGISDVCIQIERNQKKKKIFNSLAQSFSDSKKLEFGTK